MRSFTRCEGLVQGSLVAWNSSDWMFSPDIEPGEYRMETVQFSSLCSPQV